MEEHGTQVIVRSLDVTDTAAVQALVDELSASHGPVRGVVHAAVHLDDGLIANLTEARLHKVLQTKIDGIVNLDAATSSQPLEFFVAYSSATTMVGSPGRPPMSRRMPSSKASCAVAGISESRALRSAGARSPMWASSRGTRTSASGSADDGRCADPLVGSPGASRTAHQPRRHDRAVQYLTNIAQSASAEKLALLRSPAFMGLGFIKRDGQRTGSEEAALDLSGKSHAEAVEIVMGILRREVGQILRMPESKIDLSQPLADIGLDSLMALELHMALEAGARRADRGRGRRRPQSRGDGPDDRRPDAQGRGPARRNPRRHTAGASRRARGRPFNDRTVARRGQPPAGSRALLFSRSRLMAAGDDGPLSDDALAGLMEQMSGMPEPSAATFASLPTLKPPAPSVSFEEHPLYKQIKMQRDFAAFAGLRNPYYRQHEMRAGAESVIEGQPVVNFASYDYLGLNGHPEITEAVARVARDLGTSVSASRISAGERGVHRELEQALARNYETADCVAYVSGHAAPYRRLRR